MEYFQKLTIKKRYKNPQKFSNGHQKQCVINYLIATPELINA